MSYSFDVFVFKKLHRNISSYFFFNSCLLKLSVLCFFFLHMRKKNKKKKLVTSYFCFLFCFVEYRGDQLRRGVEKSQRITVLKYVIKFARKKLILTETEQVKRHAPCTCNPSRLLSLQSWYELRHSLRLFYCCLSSSLPPCSVGK